MPKRPLPKKAGKRIPRVGPRQTRTYTQGKTVGHSAVPIQQPPVLPASTRQRLPLIEPPDDQRDAARWKALLSSPLMHVLSTAAHPHSNVGKDARYILVEFATELADPILTRLPSKHLLIDYVEAIRKGHR